MTSKIQVTCRECDKRMLVPAAAVGKRIRCRDCGAAITVRVPGSRPKRRQTGPSAEPQLPPRRRKKTKKKAASPSAGKTPFIIGGVIAGLFVVGGGIYLIASRGGEAVDVAANDTEAATPDPDVAGQTSPLPSARQSSAAVPASGDTTENTAADSSIPVAAAPLATASTETSSTAQPATSTGGFAPVPTPAVSHSNAYPLEPDALTREWTDRRRMPTVRSSSS